MVVHMHDLGDTESAQLTRLCWPALRVLPAPSSTTTTITNLQTARCSRNRLHQLYRRPAGRLLETDLRTRHYSDARSYEFRYALRSVVISVCVCVCL